MSTVTDTTRSRAGDPFDPAHPSHEGGHRTRRRVSILAAIVVLAWSMLSISLRPPQWTPAGSSAWNSVKDVTLTPIVFTNSVSRGDGSP